MFPTVTAVSNRFGTAIIRRVKSHLVRSTFDSCRADAIEGSQRLRAKTGRKHGRQRPGLSVRYDRNLRADSYG